MRHLWWLNSRVWVDAVDTWRAGWPVWPLTVRWGHGMLLAGRQLRDQDGNIHEDGLEEDDDQGLELW